VLQGWALQANKTLNTGNKIEVFTMYLKVHSAGYRAQLCLPYTRHANILLVNADEWHACVEQVERVSPFDTLCAMFFVDVERRAGLSYFSLVRTRYGSWNSALCRDSLRKSWMRVSYNGRRYSRRRQRGGGVWLQRLLDSASNRRSQNGDHPCWPIMELA
jgi:hypothetical protein